jgi:hypothetical protein
MVNVVPVDRDRHAGKGWRRPVGYKFAETDAVVALVASDFSKAALSLPIGFVEQFGFFVPVMLTSPVPSHNVVVGPTGQWLTAYVPAVLRAYPFSTGTSAGGEDILCIDEASGLVVDADDTTEKFFESDGSFAPSVAAIFGLLRQTDQHRIVTNRAVVALSDAGLIKRWPLIVPVGDEQIPVQGLYCIDESALDSLDDRSLIEVRRALGLCYAQLLSMGQVDVLSKLALIQRRMGNVGQQVRQGFSGSGSTLG